jgi:hypothetical protein
MVGDGGAGGRYWGHIVGVVAALHRGPRPSRVSHDAVGRVVARTMPIATAALAQQCSALPCKPAAVALCLVVGMHCRGFNTMRLWVMLGPWRSSSDVAGGPLCGGHGSTPRWHGVVTLAQSWCACAHSASRTSVQCGAFSGRESGYGGDAAHAPGSSRSARMRRSRASAWCWASAAAGTDAGAEWACMRGVPAVCCCDSGRLRRACTQRHALLPTLPGRG